MGLYNKREMSISERYLIIKKDIIYLKIRRNIPDAIHTGKVVIIEDILKPSTKEQYTITHKRRVLKKNTKEKNKILITKENYEPIILKLLRDKLNNMNENIHISDISIGELIKGDEGVLNHIITMKEELICNLVRLIIILSIVPNDRNNYYPFQLKKTNREILVDCFTKINNIISANNKKEPIVEWV